MQGQRVDSTHELFAQGVVHRPVPRDPAHIRELGGRYAHPEMALPALGGTGMTDMLIALVHNL